MADAGSLVRRRREARQEVTGARWQLRLQAGLGGVWGVLAGLQWVDGDTSSWLRWGWVVLAVAYLGIAFTWRRRLGRAKARLAELSVVDLAPVTEAALSRLIAAALHGVAADEVTPRVTPGERWSPERVEWLRAFHRERRAGLDGPAREATWVVVEAAGDGERVVGAARLRRTDEPGVLEAGLWLVTEARGREIGRAAAELLLQRAREAGASTVRVGPTAAGLPPLLGELGFATVTDGERIVAERVLHDRA
ncbi:GNAT family N-acetyltransferase [Blastococcus sp. BMG 814]|uniref:GNAT family N-acetyltransferase n=1 Tax=Blastococcus carthaginiensis TaxID=3050034 RepID=A0ABT9IBG8_9ACTN|nr:GNAT family N-acetyltransferase [Blastococcus carthaginiensis]MDP5182908.1 GNAT family N-acetyltransferase [Blastococcus carthaginiensis]